ncbi:HEAT repeat domain-containing protein [Actinomadura rugatobispora]|uniref:HEAT repeat domain-containing protein n=1 Tax=Actinomadura rugatobispora TaxID=1994 RepID=A0ABW1AG83_9ACTN
MSRTDDRFATRPRVLRPETTVEHVDEFAKGLRWPMVSVTERDREAGTDGEVVWQADGHPVGKQVLKTGSLHYVVDAMFGIGYIRFTGTPKGLVETLASTAVQTLRPWTVEELCQSFDQAQDPRARGQAALRLGLAAPAKLDQQVFRRIGAALADGDARVRYASVFAASFSRYEAFQPNLRAIADQDPEEFLRDRAAATLRSMDGVKV